MRPVHQKPLQTYLDSGKITNITHVNRNRAVIEQFKRNKNTDPVSLDNNRRQNFLSGFAQKRPGRSLTQNKLKVKKIFRKQALCLVQT